MVTTITEPLTDESTDKTEHQIAELLDDRYGNGLSCHPRLRSNYIFKKAVDLGYVDADGYLTRKGRSLITRYQFQ